MNLLQNLLRYTCTEQLRPTLESVPFIGGNEAEFMHAKYILRGCDRAPRTRESRLPAAKTWTSPRWSPRLNSNTTCTAIWARAWPVPGTSRRSNRGSARLYIKKICFRMQTITTPPAIVCLTPKDCIDLRVMTWCQSRLTYYSLEVLSRFWLHALWRRNEHRASLCFPSAVSVILRCAAGVSWMSGRVLRKVCAVNELWKVVETGTFSVRLSFYRAFWHRNSLKFQFNWS